MRQNVKIAVAAVAALATSAAIAEERTDGRPAFGTSLITIASGERVPNFNVQPSCDPKGLIDRCVEPCLSNEKAARETLSDNWATYSAGDKNHCVSLVSKAARQAMSSSSRASRCRYTPGGSLRSARPIKPRHHR